MLLLHIAQSYEPQMINGDRRRDADGGLRGFPWSKREKGKGRQRGATTIDFYSRFSHFYFCNFSISFFIFFFTLCSLPFFVFGFVSALINDAQRVYFVIKLIN